MNSAPGQKTEKLADEKSPDRRNVMRLVPSDSSKKRGRLRIDVEDDLLSKPIYKIAPSGHRHGGVESGAEPAGVGPYGAAIAMATAIGLTIGYLLGRRENR